MGLLLPHLCENNVYKGREVSTHASHLSGHRQTGRSIKKVIQACDIAIRDYKKELKKTSRDYRTTPHPSNGCSPLQLLFNARQFLTRQPQVLSGRWFKSKLAQQKSTRWRSVTRKSLMLTSRREIAEFKKEIRCSWDNEKQKIELQWLLLPAKAVLYTEQKLFHETTGRFRLRKFTNWDDETLLRWFSQRKWPRLRCGTLLRRKQSV